MKIWTPCVHILVHKRILSVGQFFWSLGFNHSKIYRKQYFKMDEELLISLSITETCLLWLSTWLTLGYTILICYILYAYIITLSISAALVSSPSSLTSPHLPPKPSSTWNCCWSFAFSHVMQLFSCAYWLWYKLTRF